MGAALCQTKMHNQKHQSDAAFARIPSFSSLSVECTKTPSLFSDSTLLVDVEKVQSPKHKLTEAMQSHPPPAEAEGANRRKSTPNDVSNPHTYTRLREFILKNKIANEKHQSDLESCEEEPYVKELLKDKDSLKEIEKIDVFSPDERSTRWNEFFQFLALNRQGYEKFKLLTASVRGDDRAATIGGVAPDCNTQNGEMGTLH